MLRLRTAVLLGIVAGLVGGAVASLPAGLDLERGGLRLLFTVRGPVAPPAHVAVVTMDAQSASALGEPTEPIEWSRYWHACLIDNLVRRGAALIVFDVYFGKRTEHPAPPRMRALGTCGAVLGDLEHGVGADGAMAAAMRRSRTGEGSRNGSPVPVILLAYTEQQRVDVGGVELWKVSLHPPAPELYHAASAVAPFVLPKGYVEDFWPTKTIAGKEQSTLPLTVLKTYVDGRAALAGPGNAHAGPGVRYLNFYGPPATIRTVSYYDVLRPDASLDFSGDVVFVGLSQASMVEQADNFSTVFSTREHIDLSGVEIATTAFANLLDGTSVRPAGAVTRVGIVVVFGLLAGLLGGLFPARFALIPLGGLWLGWFAAAESLFAKDELWLPLVLPAAQVIAAFLLGLTARYVAARREHASVSETFRRYVPITPAQRTAQSTRTATVLFADIEGFTALGERLSPDGLVELLNEYFSAVSEPIRRYGGVITQYQGDAILAVFNVLSDDPDHAANAARAALEIQGIVERTTFGGGIALHTRIGINTGELVAGTVGSAERLTYTVHGDSVNLAARLEALNKEYHTRIIVSGATAERLGEEFHPELIGEVPIRGKEASVTVYRLA